MDISAARAALASQDRAGRGATGEGSSGTRAPRAARQPPPAPDAVSLDDVSLDDVAGAPSGAAKGAMLSQMANLKLVGVLFIVFLFVTSDVFLHSVVGNFDGAVDGRSATSWGTVVQGIFLVLFYVASLYLIDSNVI
jgi:hypothetical protein